MKNHPTHFGKARVVPLILGCAMLCMTASSCMTAGALLQPGDEQMESLHGGFVIIDDVQVPLAGGTMVLVPQSTGRDVHTGGGATLDVSNVSEGYVMVKYEGGNSKIKVQVTKAGGKTYNYDLHSRGEFEVFPLTSGNGTYQIGVFTNVQGQTYAQALGKTVEVNLRSPLLPFLYPSQYVNFSANSVAVAVGQELAKGAQDDLAIIQNVYNYVTKNISYDSAKATSVTSGNLSGYLPAVDTVLTSGKGICFDYAALMAAMLRSQQIPTRLEVGYVSGGAYHAWISTYVQNVGWVNGIIQFDGQNWKIMDPTFAASAGDTTIEQFIGTGGNYSTQYVY